MTRPWTPDEGLPGGGKRLHVKRCCEACGRPLGDVTPAELEAAVALAPLPPVADECGCPAVVEQLARALNARDKVEFETAPWAALGGDGQALYLRDAGHIVRVMVALGWGPIGPLRESLT